MRAIVCVAATMVAVSAPVAFAASLPLGSAPVGAGAALVSSCDAAGFTYSFATSGGDVTSVTVGDIADPSCEGGVLQLTLADASGASIGSAGPQTIPTDGDGAPNSLAVSPSPQPSASQIAGIHVSVSGP